MTERKEKSADFFRLISARLRGLITAVGAVACAATLLGFFGAFGWFADLFAHFRVQYFAGLTLAAVLLLILRQRKTAAFFGLVAVVNLCTILPLYFGRVDLVSASKPKLRAMLLNVNRISGKVDRVAQTIEDFNPDIVVLEEVDARWVDELRAVMAGYPHSKIQPREDNFGIALYSRLPFTRAEIVYIGEAGVPSVVAEVETKHGAFTVIATHPLPPYGGSYSRWRNDQLRKLPDHVRGATSPVLLLGDLNASPWSHHFRRLLRETGLRDSSQGRGVQPTWPTHNPLLWIPIDHCLHSPEMQVVQKKIGPQVGSDHYPVIVDFTVQSKPTDNGPTSE